jgi:hypothetical protein
MAGEAVMPNVAFGNFQGLQDGFKGRMLKTHSTPILSYGNEVTIQPEDTTDSSEVAPLSFSRCAYGELEELTDSPDTAPLSFSR